MLASYLEILGVARAALLGRLDALVPLWLAQAVEQRREEAVDLLPLVAGAWLVWPMVTVWVWEYW